MLFIFRESGLLLIETAERTRGSLCSAENKKTHIFYFTLTVWFWSFSIRGELATFDYIIPQQTGVDWSKPATVQYLQKEVQDGWLVARGAWDLHGDALLQTLSLLLLEKHLRDVAPQPLVGYVHAELECNTQHTQPVSARARACTHARVHAILSHSSETRWPVFVFDTHKHADPIWNTAPNQWCGNEWLLV